MRTNTYISKTGTKVTVKSMSMSMVVYVTECGTTTKMSYKKFMNNFTEAN